MSTAHRTVLKGAGEGERKHLTVLFSDLVGSTKIAARLDPEQWHEVVTHYQNAATEALAKLGGRVGQYLGDGIVAYFGYPEALEDAAERAVRAGLAIVRAIGALNERYAALYDIKLAVRVGLHAGSVVVAPGGGLDAGMFGDAPNVAARVQTAAAANTVLISEAVHNAVAGAFLVEDVGQRRLKGVDKPMRLFRVIGAGPARRRRHDGPGRRSAFVGREEEMRILAERYRRARASEGQVVLIAGEPGIGKSRLMEELRQALRGQPHLWIECAGESLFEKTPFHAIVQLLGQGREDDSGEARAAQLQRALAAAGLDAEETLPLVAELLDLPLPPGFASSRFASEEKRHRLIEALASWVFSAARTQFVVLAIDDLHWVDPSTLELVGELAERSSDAALLIVAATRPEFRPPWPMRSHHSQLTLNRLDRKQVRDIVAQSVGATAMAADLIEGVVERADGVPLFAEELARLMAERGARGGGHEIPETLQDSLTARLDRLGQAKETAQIGAVLGREFAYDLLRALSPLSEQELHLALAALADADLVYASGSPPHLTYRFKHSLVQDAAYEALLKRQRRALHVRVAQTIGDKFTAIAEAHPELLAHHWSEGGDADKASTAWTAAAKNAAARYAYREAADAFGRAIAALALLPESPDRDGRELQLWRWFVGMARIAYGYSAIETRKATKMARHLVKKTGDVRKQFAHIAGEWMAASSAGDYRTARTLANQLMPLAHARGLPNGLAAAHMIMMTSRLRSGDLIGAEQSFAAGEPYFSVPEFASRPGSAAQAFGNAAISAWLRGDMSEARRRIDVVRQVAGASDNPYELAFSHFMTASVELLLGDLEQAEASAQRSIELSADGRFPQFAATSSVVLGRAMTERGCAAEGLPLMLAGLQGMARNRIRVVLTMYLTWLAASYSAGGAAKEALHTLDQALAINPAERFFRPETLRLRAELVFNAGGRDDALMSLRKAVDMSKAMGAEVLHKRATASLAAMQAAGA